MSSFFICRCFLLAFALLLLVQSLSAQADPQAGTKAEPTVNKPRDTFFEHSDTTKWWISGQANFVFQAHGTWKF